MALQHAMLAAEVAGAEAAVADDALCCVLAVFEVAADLLGRPAPDRQRHVQRAVAGDVVAAECGSGGEVLAGVDEAEVGLGEVGAESEQ